MGSVLSHLGLDTSRTQTQRSALRGVREHELTTPRATRALHEQLEHQGDTISQGPSDQPATIDARTTAEPIVIRSQAPRTRSLIGIGALLVLAGGAGHGTGWAGAYAAGWRPRSTQFLQAPNDANLTGGDLSIAPNAGLPGALPGGLSGLGYADDAAALAELEAALAAEVKDAAQAPDLIAKKPGAAADGPSVKPTAPRNNHTGDPRFDPGAQQISGNGYIIDPAIGAKAPAIGEFNGQPSASSAPTHHPGSANVSP